MNRTQLTPLTTCESYLETSTGEFKLPPAASLTQASIVNEFVVKSAPSGASTKAPTPSKLNAWATMPGAKVAPFCSVALCAPEKSFAFPSPGYQRRSPGGGAMHVCATAPLVVINSAKSAKSLMECLRVMSAELAKVVEFLTKGIVMF